MALDTTHWCTLHRHRRLVKTTSQPPASDYTGRCRRRLGDDADAAHILATEVPLALNDLAVRFEGGTLIAVRRRCVDERPGEDSGKRLATLLGVVDDDGELDDVGSGLLCFGHCRFSLVDPSIRDGEAITNELESSEAYGSGDGSFYFAFAFD